MPALRGHQDAKRLLASAARAGTLGQSVLLHGPAGIGKERVGLWLAQLLVCEHPDARGNPCGGCLACRLVLRLEHPDVHWFFPMARPEGASGDRLRDKLEEQRSVELQARRLEPHRVPAHERPPAHFLAAVQTIQQLASVRPAMGRRKVFVVGDAELMVPQESSPEAANAFLKLLEEPPADTYIVLTTASPGALLDTIRSRVTPLRLKPLGAAEIADFLATEMALAAADASNLAAQARGAIGRALRLVPGGDGPGPLAKHHQKGREMLLAALSGNAVTRLSTAHENRPSGARGEFLGDLAALSEWLRDLLAAASGSEESVAEPEARRLLARAVERHNPPPLGIAKALEAVARATELARGNVNPQLIVAGLLHDVQRQLRPDLTN
jgi:DNA polymerase-3 subunit delta'